MGFAPRGNGEILPYVFTPRHPERLVIDDDMYDAAWRLAMEFWNSVAQDDRISEEFRNFLNEGNPAEMMK
jgi:hypothetical protein